MKNLKGTQGSGIILLVLLLATLQILMIVNLSSYVRARSVDVQRNKVRSTRDGLVYMLKKSATDPAALRNSMIANPVTNANLVHCVTGDIPLSCISGESYNFSLYSSLDPVAVAGAGAAGDSSSQPVFYNRNGEICSGAGANLATNCPLQAVSSFTPVCAGGVAVCDVALSIQVTYVVSYVAQSLTLSQALKATSQVYSIDVDKIMPPMSSQSLASANASQTSTIDTTYAQLTSIDAPAVSPDPSSGQATDSSAVAADPSTSDSTPASDGSSNSSRRGSRGNSNSSSHSSSHHGGMTPVPVAQSPAPDTEDTSPTVATNTNSTRSARNRPSTGGQSGGTSGSSSSSDSTPSTAASATAGSPSDPVSAVQDPTQTAAPTDTAVATPTAPATSTASSGTASGTINSCTSNCTCGSGQALIGGVCAPVGFF